jgi:hypothetical protein
MKPAAVLNLAYILVASPLPNVYLGGLMVTDRHGLPLEFRYTEPIQPSKIQQVLYGQVLNSYIKREVILETLLKNIDVPFKALLVEDEALLEITSKSYSVGRLAITKSPPIGPVGKRQELGAGELLLQVTAEGNPLRLTMPAPAHSSPSASGGAIPVSGSTIGILEMASSAKTTEAEVGSGEETSRHSRPDLPALLLDAGQTMDLAEPLRRIEKALELICHEEGLTTTASPVGARSANN